MQQLELFARETRKIYESPDGGKTIYVREFGSLERTLLIPSKKSS